MTLYALHIDAVRRRDPAILMERMPRRMERAGRFRFEDDRLRCMGAGFLLLEIAGIPDESVLCFGENEKPFAPGFPHFNLSHSGDWVVLALDDGEVGVDIEGLSPGNLSVARRVLTPGELRWMEEAPLERFHTLWTVKEAVIKATGRGLSLDMRGFDALPLLRGNSIEVERRRWYAAAGGFEGYRYAVCATHPVEGIQWKVL